MKKLLPVLSFLLLAAAPVFSQQNYLVRFEHGAEVFPQNFAEALHNAPVSKAELANGYYARFIQLEYVMDAAQRAEFESTGAKIISYVTYGAYLVLLPQNFDFQQLSKFSPRSVLPVKPEWKIARSLREQPYGAWAVHGDRIDVNLQLYPSLRIAEGAQQCRDLGIEVLKEGTQNGLVQVRIGKEQVAELAAMPFVRYLELIPPPGEKEDTRGRSLHRSNLVASDAPAGKKYDGTGVSVLVRDDGQLGPHIDLQGRLHNYAVDPPASGTHGDGVVGIVGGAGNLDPSKKGMAAGADLYSVDYINDFQDLTLPLHLNENVTITNSSYSDGCNAGYTLATQTVDQQIFEHPTLMHVFSAGNSNTSDCGYGAGTEWGNITGGHKMAKNAIATANLYADATLVESSSRGPAYDGRMKPDIAANGQDQNSLAPDNEYQVFGGTSGAAPGIAGCLAQLTHAYRTIYSMPDAPSALLKATILNTATDLGNAGPDYKFGWGHINTWRALQVLEQNRWLEGDADQNGDVTHQIQIPNGVKEAKIMIYWAEPPSAENNARALLNDLDLTVNSPNSTVNLPWRLDPTPDPVTLDLPAGKGRDSLNNTEQVFLENPSAGLYTVHVKGTEVPLGPQHYYLVWEFVKDEIKITYPAGGEGFAPGEIERIHWDAYGNTGTFTLRYSTDNGNTFLPIGSVGGDRRMYDWTVPNTVSGQVRFLVIRSSKRDTTDFPFSIVPIPQNIEVAKVCPDSITLSWSEVHDTLSYDAYLLGNKYMEIKGTSSTNSISFPIQDAGAEKWVAVRTSHPDGTAGRRSIAIRWPGQLKECPQNYDLAVRELFSPGGDAIVTCGETAASVIIQVVNEGLNTISGATAFYQLDNNPAVSQVLPDLLPSEGQYFTFSSPLLINTNGTVTLKTWVVYPGDLATFNDTLSFNLQVITQAANQFFVEDFDASTELPDGWASINPDGAIGWTVLPYDLAGTTEHSIYLNCFQYSDRGQEDFLYMIPIDLAGLSQPGLVFDLAHAEYDASYRDALRVEVFANCDLNAAPDTVWSKIDPELATVPATTALYTPASLADFRTETIDLSAYAGQKIVVRFVSTNDFGNSIFIDNIGLEGFVPPVPPIAEFAAPDSICRLDNQIYEAAPSTDDSDYAWIFGSGAVPSAANGLGPHSILYTTAGDKTVRLIVTNGVGADTLIRIVNVRPLATANFTVVNIDLTATFSNSSTNADSYLWDFGDGMTSTEINPVHNYATSGTYTVTLSAKNVCRTHQKSITIIGVSSVNELTTRIGISILPNPTSGDFAVMLDSQIEGEVQLQLFDATGRKVTKQETVVKQGAISRVQFSNLHLPKGLYQLSVQSEGRVATFSVVVQ